MLLKIPRSQSWADSCASVWLTQHLHQTGHERCQADKVPPFEGLLSACHTHSPVEGFLRRTGLYHPNTADGIQDQHQRWPMRWPGQSVLPSRSMSLWIVGDWPTNQTLSRGKFGFVIYKENDLRVENCRW